MRITLLGAAAAGVLILAGPPSVTAIPNNPASALAQKEFFRRDLYISSANVPVREVLVHLPNREAWESFLASRPAKRPVAAYIDPRSGAATSVIGVFPLIPGSGVGNDVTLAEVSAALGRPTKAVDEATVGDLVLRFVRAHHAILGIDPDQLGEPRARSVTPDLWQVRIPQVFRGVPVRHGHLIAAISHGNLVLTGTETWGNVRIDPDPTVTAAQALDAGFAFAGDRQPDDVVLASPTLEIVPYAPPELQDGEAFAGPVGAGYRHRLVWSFRFQRAPEIEQWEVLVDAHDGAILAFEDKNHYAAKQVTGGVYPLTSTDICPTPQTCGVMQLGTPMPWANTGLPAPNDFANSAGLFDYTSGTVTSTLAGRYVAINDSCGPIELSSTTGDLAFGGTPGDHVCTTPGFGGAGNTSASRSIFYGANRIAEIARGYLPSNTWLQSVLTANVNVIQSNCGGFWNGTSINFCRPFGSGRSPGENQSVMAHEWGHGLDDNDSGGFLSSSSEAYGDIASVFRHQASCLYHGLAAPSSPPSVCGLAADGSGDNANEANVGPAHCDTDCSGARDADWMKHAPAVPDTPLGFVCSSCTPSSGPCGREVHCAAAPSRQAAWDLAARDLQSPPFNMNRTTAFVTASRIFFQGSGSIGSWHSCTCGGSSNGCGATNAYMLWLVADDDNGSLSNGTPHMTAIHAAFDRHGIACPAPAPSNNGCAAGPSAAPSLSGAAGTNQVTLSWTAVPGATRYWIFRGEGHAGCDTGKALVGEATGLSYVDSQLANGRPYSYDVVAAGVSSSCFGAASNCLTVTPSPTADFAFSCAPTTVNVPQGGVGTSTCTVQSVAGFTDPVSFSCAGLPPGGIQCHFNPSMATPPPNASVDTALDIDVGLLPTGTYTFQARATSGALVRDVTLTVNVAAALVAVALAVDATGNGVYQPNETVVVAPAWRNLHTNAIAADGALSSHTGPGGPTYSISDGTASYGSIAAGGISSCTATTNCYSVGNVAFTRPATHWDSTAIETLTPTSITKTWTLHVGDSFLDVPSAGPFYRFIETVLHNAVTGGCSATAYCPSAPTSREQMAVFVLVAREGAGYAPPACTTPMFADVPAASPFCPWIEELARRAVVSGCGGGNYCPQAPATREQMAVFVLRTLDPSLNPPPCGTPVYADVPASSAFCRWIEELTRRGVVTGCGAGNYCPSANVSREQMSVFLAVTFGLVLYAP